MKFIILIGLLALIPFLTATSTDDSSDEIKNKELSRERRAAVCPTVQFSRAKMPTVWDNMDNAINVVGKTATLNRVANSADNDQNRRDSGCPALTKKTGNAKAKGISCDEYPFASSTQGGTGAVIKMVNARDNNAQGGTLSSFYQSSKIGPGGCYTVELID